MSNLTSDELKTLFPTDYEEEEEQPKTVEELLSATAPEVYVPSEERIAPQDREPLQPGFLQAAKTEVTKGIGLAGQMTGLFEPEQTAAEKFVQKVNDDDERYFSKLTRQDLEEDEDFVARVKRYRKDRMGVDEDAPAANLFFGYVQDSTDENIVDDYIDHYRFMTNNSMDAYDELAWLEDIRKKEQRAIDMGNIEEANRLAEVRENAAIIYQKAERLASLVDSERYEGQSLMSSVADIGETVGVNFLAALSDPTAIVSAGVGKLIGSQFQKEGAKRILSAAYGFGAGAVVDGPASAYLDGLIQQSEIEMGLRTSIDYTRMAQVSGIAAVTSGVVGATGSLISTSPKKMKQLDDLSRGKLTAAFNRNRKKQVKLAEETNAKFKETSMDLRNRLADSIEKNYGKGTIKRDKDGNATGVDEAAFRKHTEKVLEGSPVDPDMVALRLSNETNERVFAAITDIIESMKNGTVKATIRKDVDVTVSDLVSKLQKDETVSERIANILVSVDARTQRQLHAILGKYGVTKREIGAATLSEATDAGRLLAFRSMTAKQLGHLKPKEAEKLARLNESRTPDEIKTDQQVLSENEKLRKRIVKGKKDPTKPGVPRRLENIRRLSLVSAISTAVANTMGGVIRTAVDTPVYALESAINPSKKFSFNGTLSHLKYVITSREEAANMTKFLLSHFPEQNSRFFNAYTESMQDLTNANMGQAALGKFEKGVKGSGKKGKFDPLDFVEGAYHLLNSINRFQEFVFRNTMFSASMTRHFINNPVPHPRTGKPMSYTDVLRTGRVMEYIDEDVISKGVSDALEVTYASAPEFGAFNKLNNFIVNSYLTIALPFPRFMFKAMEMSYNYNYTGIAHGATALAYKGAKKLITGKDTGIDREFRRIAEGAAGGIPLISLGYMLRDPEGQSRGSEWYMIKDGKGNEIDGRYFFPLTPYLLIGEMMHRAEDHYFMAGTTKQFEDATGIDIPRIDYGLNIKELIKIAQGKKGAGALFEEDTWRLYGSYDLPRPTAAVQAREILEGFTGASFRSSSPLATFTRDILTGIDEGFTTDNYKPTVKFAEMISEAATGYMQPLLQIADMPFQFSEDGSLHLADAYQRRKDYRDNTEYADRVEAFFAGLATPWRKRLDRIAERFDADDDTLPDFEDPRFDHVPERVKPFMKVFFGARLTRIPPHYVAELNKYGFTYKDFMSYSGNDKMRTEMNRKMGYSMQQNMPLVLMAARKQAEDMGITDPSQRDKYIAAEARAWLTLEKKAIKAQTKLEDVDSAMAALIDRYRSIPHYNKQYAISAFESENPGVEIDISNPDHVNDLITYSKDMPLSKRLDKSLKGTQR